MSDLTFWRVIAFLAWTNVFIFIVLYVGADRRAKRWEKFATETVDKVCAAMGELRRKP